MNKKENCYIYVSPDSADDSCMNILCEECHKKNPVGWFWEGAKLGYGPYDFICDTCGHIIHKKLEKVNE